VLRTPIYQFHVDQGAQMVEYAGWEMPMKYEGIAKEHQQVRTSGGMFDVSHMGRLELKGLHARRLLERVCSRRIGTMKEHRCRYTLITNERGGVKDDALVYRMDDDSFLIVVNGANRAKIVDHFRGVIDADGLKLDLNDTTEKTAMLAAQGPRIPELVSRVSNEIPSLKKYQFTVKNFLVMKLIVSRTGYTGEDGFEVIMPANAVQMAMKLLMKDIDPKAPESPMKPAGLGARDTLRLEAGMPLYGHELGEDINALATGLDFAISLDKNEDEDGATFIGQDALVKTREEGGTPRTLVGLRVEGRRTARQGMAVRVAGEEERAGEITSGCVSPTLEASIAMAYVDRRHAAEGTPLEIETGRAELPATVTPLPFYKRPS